MGASLKRPRLRYATDDAALQSVIRRGIPGTGMPGNWFLKDSEIRDIVDHVRSLGRVAFERLPGEPEKGRLVYDAADCSRCHIVRGRGSSLGPELTDIGNRRGIEFLRRAITHPGSERALDASGYATHLPVVLITVAGHVVTGTRINEDSFSIQLRDDKNSIHSFRKRDLEVVEEVDGSIMPGYERTLSREEVDHLVSYLASLKGSP